MPPPPPDDTDLTDADRTYLKSCLVNYRSTPGPDKAKFRINCVEYILRQRSLSADVYAYKFLCLKVKNWFQNHARKIKAAPLPVRVNQGISSVRAFALKNEGLIREAVTERKEAADEEELPHLATWNNTTRQLWAELPEADWLAYTRLAAKWAVEGPEDAIKPILAEKRAPAWMRSVAVLFWTQCNMPIFIYGMYKDKDGGLHAAVYDTSNLWRETDKSVPLLHNVPGWDQDFRRVAWTFFQATLRPDLAAPETLQVMKASKRHPPAPVHFDHYDDQCPILFHTEDGKGFNNSRRQEIFHEYMKAHYSLAAGSEMRAPPWGSLRERPSNFFEDGMLPVGFRFNDPSHIPETILTPFFDHVMKMESPESPNVPARRFRFYRFERGTGEHRTYHPVVYNGRVEPAPPRRGKKAVSVPVFEDPPSPTPGPSTLDDDSLDAPSTDLPTALSPLAAALQSDFDAMREEVLAEMAVGAGGDTHSTEIAAVETADTVKTGRQPRRTAASQAATPVSDNPWLDAEIDAAAPEWDEESDLTEEEYDPQLDGDDGNEDDDDEVEGFLTDIAAAEIISLGGGEPAVRLAHAISHTPHGVGTSIVTAQPSVGTTGAGSQCTAAENPLLLAPAAVPADGPSRLAFLRGLSMRKEYVDLLRRMDEALQSPTSIRAQNPVFWGTWGHKSPHVPETVHTNDKKAAQLLKWLLKQRDATSTAVDIQRFCLVVGMSLRDLDLIESTDGTTIWPDNVPGFMARSSLEPSVRGEILAACATAFETAGGASSGATGGKGKGKAKTSNAGGLAACEATSSQSSEPLMDTERVRRSKRTTTRRT